MSTLLDWKLACPEFLHAIEQGRQQAQPEFHTDLYRAAIGYSQHEFKQVRADDGEIITVPVERHVMPNTHALIFWLKHRRPQEWGGPC